MYNLYTQYITYALLQMMGGPGQGTDRYTVCVCVCMWLTHAVLLCVYDSVVHV